MVDRDSVHTALKAILDAYQATFSAKVYNSENDDTDLLMGIFGITPELKRENRQYWGRELGMCWQRLVTEICRQSRSDFGPALRVGADEPCDLTVGRAAIDTKYRIGSGDSGTLKKFKAYGPLLKKDGYEPILLILREDNLPAAITACKAGGWTVLMGDQTIDYVEKLTRFDLKSYLTKATLAYAILRGGA